ncbi:dinuclear metal center YbgI/SA1388 family protein [Balneicella halophila]|uniref:GTP cyclohydrolase 1 type 2 homolog n=1 Tax=Balneicella halophila TaxID=1537566 RepID=A0A7L4UPA1_BALHA|nr:Nif3-like dinuclear metal center hexameric protein [Balneicella halophila]PVX50951.1 dinuclear metal center YbgI/SA1388 family protein [Balneicella halophila]
MPTVKDICKIIEKLAPTSYQESYDNAGLLVGDADMELTGVLLSVDITEEVVEEAIANNANMVVAHHPIIFKGLKRLTGRNYVERTVIKAIQNNIALYASHTNLDSVQGGVNTKISEMLGLQDIHMLSTKKDNLLKLVSFVPVSHVETVNKALFSAGCGHIGNYDKCSFNTKGLGTFRALDGTTPYVGKQNELHKEEEIRTETILPRHLLSQAIATLKTAHPYEEVAYDIYELENEDPSVGIGCIGKLRESMPTKDFLEFVKDTFNLKVIRHTPLCKDKISTVAVCGGSGSFLLENAKRANADIFITGDFKYHDFFDADRQIIIADIGHYESERCSMEIFNELITENLPNFATTFTKLDTNPINYFL